MTRYQVKVGVATILVILIGILLTITLIQGAAPSGPAEFPSPFGL